MEKGVRMISQLHFLHISCHRPLSPPESEIRAGKLLDDEGHLQEEPVGGHPHHHYIKACPSCPVVDRALQKNTRIANEHAKKLSEASVSLK